MSITPSLDAAPGGIDRWITSWVATWLAGVVASSLALAALVPAAGDGSATDPSIVALTVSLVVLWSVYLVGMAIASRRVGTGRPVEDFALAARPIDLLGIPLGIVSQLVLVPVLYAPLRRLAPATFDDDALQETARDLVDRADGGLIVLLFVAVVVGAPVVEELFYRGFLQHPIVMRLGDARARWIAVVAVAVVFGAIHFRPVEFPGLFAFGLVLGVCLMLTGRIGMSIAAHVAFNATGLVLAL